ncbi:unnamed protein product [Ixodes pacificus]
MHKKQKKLCLHTRNVCVSTIRRTSAQFSKIAGLGGFGSEHALAVQTLPLVWQNETAIFSC